MAIRDLNVTEDDLIQAREAAKDFTLEETREVYSSSFLHCHSPNFEIDVDSIPQMINNVFQVHGKDPNFPILILDKIQEFLGNEDIFDHPEQYNELVAEMKTEAALIANNSPYAEVRAVVSNTDDVNIPSSTIRAWVCCFLRSCLQTAWMFPGIGKTIEYSHADFPLLRLLVCYSLSPWLSLINFSLFDSLRSISRPTWYNCFAIPLGEQRQPSFQIGDLLFLDLDTA